MEWESNLMHGTVRLYVGNRKISLTLLSSVIFFLLVPAGALYIGGKIDRILDIVNFDFGFTGKILSVPLFLVGAYYVIESIRILLVRGKGVPLGDVFPKDQTSELITKGVYSQTRNPMIFGYLACVCAVGLSLNSVSTTFIIPLFFIILWTIWLKKMEEPALERRFEKQYIEYRKKTPYLVPRPRK